MHPRTLAILLLLTASATLSGQEQQGPQPPADRIVLDLGLSYGYGEYHAFGATAGFGYGFALWSDTISQGWLNLGVLAGYQAAPFSQYDALMPDSSTTGAANRIELMGQLGLVLDFPQAADFLLGIGLVCGWVHVFMDGSLDNSHYGISSGYQADYGALATGVSLDLGIALDHNLDLLLDITGFIPYTDSAVTGYLLASLGLGIHL